MNDEQAYLEWVLGTFDKSSQNLVTFCTSVAQTLFEELSQQSLILTPELAREG
jgi:hypothetical protein